MERTQTIHNIKYHQNISNGFQVDTKLQLKQSRGNNSESLKVRVVIFICDTLL